MRDIELTDRNEVEMIDNLSGGKITIYHATIETSLRSQYQSALVNCAVNSKDPASVYNLQVEWGDKIMTGFKKGSFSIKGVPFACEKDDPDYNPLWRELIKKVAGDILVTLSNHLLGETNTIVKKNFPSVRK